MQQTRNLSRRLRPSKEAELIVRDLDDDFPGKQLGGLVCETCHVLARADEILSQNTFDSVSISTLSEIVCSSILLDKRLEAWSNEVSGDYGYASMEALHLPSFAEPPWGSQPGMPIHVYKGSSTATMWNIYRCSRIMLLQYLMKCIARNAQCGATDLASPRLFGIKSEAAESISSLCSDVFASVPYLLGEIDQDGNLQQCRHSKAIGGFLLLWPLRLILFLDVIEPWQKAWIMRRLTYIKNVLGIQRAAEPLRENFHVS